jgi:hypothetical protein
MVGPSRVAGFAQAMAAVSLAAAAGLAAQTPAINSPVETLKATGGLPAHIVGTFDDPAGFAEAESGEFLVLDRRAHTVYAINAKKTLVRTVLTIGFEQGRVLQPAVLALGGDILAVADAPAGYERIQFFTLKGLHIGGFNLYTRVKARLWVGPLVVNGVASIAFTGKTFLVSRPDTGALMSEHDMSGSILRHIGTLRPTGHEDDRDLHLAFNVGLPLVEPDGGSYFVFQTGRPLIRKYDATGTLVFERHIEGTELDGQILSQPTSWRPRNAEEGFLPLVMPLVRTAAVDRTGRLWISLMTPFTYVYDGRGEKVRTIQFDGAGVLSPQSLFFTPDGRVLVTPGCYEFSAR